MEYPGRTHVFFVFGPELLELACWGKGAGGRGCSIAWWTWFVFRVSDFLGRDPELEVPKG